MRRKGVIIGVVLVALLSAGIVALLLWPEQTNEPEPTPSPPSLADTNADMVNVLWDELSSVHFIPAEGSSFSINIKAESNEMELEAVDAIFSGSYMAMHSLAITATNLTFLPRIIENADDSQLSLFGFDDPDMRVRIERVDGTSIEFEVGVIQAAGHRRYTRISGSREVFLLNERQSDFLTLGLDDVYDTSFIPLEIIGDQDTVVQSISHVVLEREDEIIEIRKRFNDDFEGMPLGTSMFRILQPVISECNDYYVRSDLLEGIAQIRPSGIVTKQPADLSIYGLDDPARLTVAIEGFWSGTLLIGDRDIERGGRFVMLEGYDAVLLDRHGDYSFLNVVLSRIRSSLIWLHNIEGVSSVVFDLDGTTRTLRFEHGATSTDLRGWLDEEEISATNARRLFRAVLMISQSGSANEPVPGSGALDYTITINSLDGSSDQIELYRLNQSQFLIVHNGYNTGFYITRMLLQQNLLGKFDIIDAGGDIPSN